MIFRRHPSPVLTRRDIPDCPPDVIDASSVFNPGVAIWRGQVLALLRVQTRGRRTVLWRAISDDGISFALDDAPLRIEGLDVGDVFHVYDPRLTVIDDELIVCFAMDLEDGCRLGIARSKDGRRFESLGRSDENLRNGVLFPERIGGRFARLERPNLPDDEYAGGGDSIRLAFSDDLIEWHPGAQVMRGRPRYWDERIGSGPPPLRCKEGWLHIYHGVATHFGAASVYQAGVVLLAADDPARVLARGRDNILEPREDWELQGQVPNVVFPTGLVEHGDGLMLYYGAADTCVGLAHTQTSDLVAAAYRIGE